LDQLKKFTTSELVMLGGSLAVFIGTFMKWFKADVGAFSTSVNGFEYFFQGTIPWILAILVAGTLIARKLANVSLPDLPLPWSQVYLIACGAAAFLILTRIISTDGPSEFVDRGLGIFLAFLGGIAMAVGAFLKFQAKEDDDAGAATGQPPTPF
jgi:hypothetical protein